MDVCPLSNPQITWIRFNRSFSTVVCLISAMLDWAPRVRSVSPVCCARGRHRITRRMGGRDWFYLHSRYPFFRIGDLALPEKSLGSWAGKKSWAEDRSGGRCWDRWPGPHPSPCTHSCWPPFPPEAGTLAQPWTSRLARWNSLKFSVCPLGPLSLPWEELPLGPGVQNEAEQAWSSPTTGSRAQPASSADQTISCLGQPAASPP